MDDHRPFLITLYCVLASALTPLFNLLFALRSRSGKEIHSRKAERFGDAQTERPSGKLVWIHAASVGETMSVLPLIERLVLLDQNVLLTTVTVTAADIAEKRLPNGALHQFVPYDAPGPVAKFLAHWKPDLVMVVESEIWPCLFDQMRALKTPFILLNGRLSDRSHKSWSRVAGVARYIFQCLDSVFAQSEADAERFKKLGCNQVLAPGNLKFDVPKPHAVSTEIDKLQTEMQGRKTWLAALTHPGEDEIALSAFKQLKAVFPDLLMLLVPRHPARADAIFELLQANELVVARRSHRDAITQETDVYLGDTLGEMGLFYALAPVTFLGGSFNEAGGHNPVEAALSYSALVTGPYVSNARAVYKEFWIGDAALRAETPEELIEKAKQLLSEPNFAEAQAQRAKALVEAGQGALEKTLQHLRPYLQGNQVDDLAEINREDRA